MPPYLQPAAGHPIAGGTLELGETVVAGKQQHVARPAELAG